MKPNRCDRETGPSVTLQFYIGFDNSHYGRLRSLLGGVRLTASRANSPLLGGDASGAAQLKTVSPVAGTHVSLL